MTKNDWLTKLYLDNALYTFEFDLYDGIIQTDIIGKDGANYTKLSCLESPCKFDDLAERLYDPNYFGAIHISTSQVTRISHSFLIDSYKNHCNNISAILYIPKADSYFYFAYYLIPAEDVNESPHVIVVCIDITQEEKSRQNIYGSLRDAKAEIEDIIASAKIGIWRIYLFDGETPKMSASPTMCKLLGINADGLSDEEIYNAWYSRIKRSSLPSVEASVNEMIEKGFSENTYIWNHPTQGEIYVRCGGTSINVENKGHILRGYHSDVTNIVTSETKHKQLLADALDEVSRQKHLLQQALDNYKEADYDRRRDFLTGLRNRQDMFEMFQDVLSSKRDNITSMFMMDIDNFKLLNDHYGHKYGDQCLQSIGKALNEYSEKHDIYFYRYGGEEILGINLDKNRAADEIADDLLEVIAKLDIKRDDSPLGRVSVSIGYTTNNSRYEKMVDKADEAMSRAKTNGKNQAICYESI